MEVDLCQLHLAELGGVGEVQRLWEGRWQAEKRRNGNKMCNVLEGRRESRAEPRKWECKGWMRTVKGEGGWRLCEETEVSDWPQVSSFDLYLSWRFLMSVHKDSARIAGPLAPFVCFFCTPPPPPKLYLQVHLILITVRHVRNRSALITLPPVGPFWRGRRSKLHQSR